MTSPVRKVLFITATIKDEERFRALLSEYSYHILTAETRTAIRSHCRNHDFDFIVTGPGVDGALKSPAKAEFPNCLPILYIDAEPPENCAGFDYVCTPSSVSHEGFASLCGLLSRIRDLQRESVSKDRQIAEIEQILGQQQQSMKQHSDFLDVLASRDGLTGLFNRRHLNKILSREFKHYLEQGVDLSLMILDLDFFDEVNRTAGRTYGDFVLNDFAARLTSITLPKGICFRFSGEVFVTLLPDTEITEATVIAETIRKNLSEKPFTQGNVQHDITVSIGIASIVEHHPEDPDHFITMAERALFSAKSEGRNRVAIHNMVDPATTDTSQQSIAMVKETLTKILEKTKKSAIESLQLLAKDIAGKENQSHIKAVRHYVELLGRQMNLPEPLIRTFKNAITLHTSIRLLLHKEMIGKRQEFTSDEREVMNDFPYKLLELTELFDFFSSERMILLHHAERYDGYGSPEGLKGDEIPMGARLFALVDALAAMNADRPHRKRLAPEQIIDQLLAGAGTQFDPVLVHRALIMLKSHRLLDVEQVIIEQALQTIESASPSHFT